MQITIRRQKSFAVHLSEQRGRKGHTMPHIDLGAVFGQRYNVLIPKRVKKKSYKSIFMLFSLDVRSGRLWSFHFWDKNPKNG